MVHKNYHVFKADSNAELGFLMGQAFSNEAKNAISIAKKDKWDRRMEKGKIFLDITQEHFPHYIEELRGYAEGAGVAFPDLWIVSIEGDGEIQTSAKCTSIITNEGKLIGHNEDADRPGLENSVCLVKKTLGNLTTFEIYYYNTLGGNSIGVSSFGFAHALNTLFFTGNKSGIPKNVIARYLLETDDPDATIKKVITLPRVSGYNHNIIDKSGKMWNLELTADKGILTNPASPFAHSNHCLNIESDTTNECGTMSRLEFAQNNTKRDMTINELMKLQGDTSKGPIDSICNERTIGKMIINFETMTASAWLLREKEAGWIDYPLDFIS